MGNINAKSVMVYPFRAPYIPFITHLNFFRNDLSVNSVVTFNGSGLIGKDIGFSENSKMYNILVESNSPEIIKKNDLLLVLPEKEAAVKKMAYDIMKSAIRFNKDIICLMELDSEDLSYIKKASEKANINFSYMLNTKYEQMDKNATTVLFSPTVPVVFVGGLIEPANQFDIVTFIYKAMKKKGYRVSVLSDTSACEFFGFHNYNWILKSHISEVEKIRLLNQLIYCVDKEEHPNLIIIQLAGTMMRLNNFIPSDFGIYATMISEAVIPDYFVCCSMFGMYDTESYKGISQYFNNRFGFSINCVHLTNKLLNAHASLEAKEMRFINVSYEKLKFQLKQLKTTTSIPIYNLLENEEQEIMLKNMLNELLKK